MQMVASDPAIVTELMNHLRRCNRSKPHAPALHALLAVLLNAARYAALLPPLFQSHDCLEILTEKLQMFRDTEVWIMRACHTY